MTEQGFRYGKKIFKVHIQGMTSLNPEKPKQFLTGVTRLHEKALVLHQMTKLIGPGE